MNFQSLILDVNKVETQAGLLALLSQYFKGYGIDRIIWLYIPPESLFEHGKLSLCHAGYEDFPEMINVLETGVRDMRGVTRAELRSHNEHAPHIRGNEQYKGVFETISKNILRALNSRNIEPGLRVATYGPKQKDSIFDIAKPTQSKISKEEIQSACQAVHMRLCELKENDWVSIFGLTERELHVLEGVSRGLSNKEIAKELGLSPHTVNSYFRAIALKLNVSDRVAAATKSIDLGII
jgi:DNA-binding CsgD family transcriptional regulator